MKSIKVLTQSQFKVITTKHILKTTQRTYFFERITLNTNKRALYTKTNQIFFKKHIVNEITDSLM